MSDHIGAIKVGPRHRRDLGDIDALAKSISQHDLLHPIGMDKDNPPVSDAVPAVRLRHLANQIHRWGPFSLSYLFDELVAGADPLERIEAFARLSPLADFIQANREDLFSSPLFLVEGKDCND
jgi:hypothetical protein